MPFERTWQTFINRSLDTTNGWYNGKSIAWTLKALLKGEFDLTSSAGGPISTGSIQGKWTHYRSCDGTSVSGVSDLWTSSYTPSKIVPRSSPGANLSWITLKSPTSMGTTVYFTISMEESSGYEIDFAMSFVAPTFSGSTTSRPSHPLEVSWTGASGEGNVNHGLSLPRAHGGLTSTGDFYFINPDSGIVPWTCILQKLSNAKDNDSYPVIALMNGVNAGGDEPLYRDNISVSNPSFCKSRHVSNAGNVYPSAVSWWNGGGAVGLELAVADPVDGNMSDMPVYWWINKASKYSIKGRFADITWCNQSLSNGDTLSATSMQTMVVCDMALPTYGTPSFA